MIKKLETKEDVLNEINLLSNDFLKPEEKDIFVKGAFWLLDIKNEEIAKLQTKINSQRNKINEYCTRINDYDSMYFGIEPSKRGRKPKNKTKRKEDDNDDFQPIFQSLSDMKIDIEDDDNDDERNEYYE